MKITDSQVIRDGEKELINAVKNEIDPEKIRDIISHKLSRGNLMAKDGQIVVHNNQVAFQLNFELQFTGSILLDREGNLISDTPVNLDNSSASDVLEQEEELDSSDDEVMEGEDSSVEDFDRKLAEDENPAEDEDETEDSDEYIELEEAMPDSEFVELEEDPLSEAEEQEDENMEDILFDSESPGKEAGDDEELLTDDHQAQGTDEDILEDDINEILEESRAFWKQSKKE